MKMKIEAEVRPCMIPVRQDGQQPSWQKALFHMWQEGNAVVELENGIVGVIPANMVRFLDSQYLFKQFVWGDEQQQMVQTEAPSEIKHDAEFDEKDLAEEVNAN